MFDRTLLPSPSLYYGQLFTLKGSKTQVLVPCCFHHDKSPSLSINLIKGVFNCLGCPAQGGDVLDFHKLKHGLNTIEAAKDLGAWIDTKGDTQDELAARKKKIADADKAHKALLEQAAKVEIANAQAFIPLLANILELTTKPTFEPPYCVDKRIQSHTLLTIDAADIQRFTLPVDPYEPTKQPVTVCYGFDGVLTVAILETLDGEQVALQVFDGVPDDKNKFARWLIGKPTVMEAYYRLGDWTSPSMALITEGIADAISCYEATGYPVLAAISKSQLVKAALAVKRKYPQITIVVCGDNDTDGGGQRAAHEAAKAVDGLVALPVGVKDCNDLHQAQGLEAVKQMINDAIDNGLQGVDGQESEDSAIERLAKLSAIDYERLRVEEAKKLTIRATVLDKLVAAKRREGQSQDDTNAGTSAIFEDVTAWPYSVNGAALLQNMTNIVQRFTVLSIEQARACALWIAFTWFINEAKVAPMINITSPEKRCGKSTLLLVIESMVSKPLLASNISGAALFRSIELWTPTLLIDETDAFLNEKEELRGMLNAGHYRKTAFVIRTVGDSHEPKKFMTWCAKVLCGIGKIAHTLTDRSIVIELRRKLVNETVENIHLTDESEFAVIRQKLKRWYEDNSEQYRALRPVRIEGINDRAADNWQPLQAVAELAGGEWPRLCKHAAITLSGIEEETPSINVELLMDIAEVFHDRGATKIFTADLLDALCQDDEKAYSTWNRGRPITSRQIGQRVKDFGVKSRQMKIGHVNNNGYELMQINEALIRYKPTSTPTYASTSTPPSTPLQANDTNGCSDFDNLYHKSKVEDRKPTKANDTNGCRVVEDRNPTTTTINGHSGEVII